MSDELGLYDYLLKTLYLAQGERTPSQWVMNAEWLAEIKRMTGTDGRPFWAPSIDVTAVETLFGKPIEVREDGGAPHLEPHLEPA